MDRDADTSCCRIVLHTPFPEKIKRTPCDVTLVKKTARLV